MTLHPVLRHYGRTLVHKWFVLAAGRRLRVPLWQLVVHDLSKFGPWEATGYAHRYFGGAGDAFLFAIAWNHHQKSNPHHWEYWVPEGKEPLEMPERYVREMVADWMAASRAYNGRWPTDRETWDWYQKNWDRIRLHPQTRAMADSVLVEALGELMQ